MQSIRYGRQFRALRIRKEVRQADVARIARLSRAVVSRIDRGLIGNIRVEDLERAAAALGAIVDLRLRWNGEQLDRLVDEAHARLVDLAVALLRATGWEVAVEVSFSIWGERGSIDVLAYHRATGTILVVEVKSVVPDSQSTLHGLDRKTRLARQIAEQRGWDCRTVARLLIVGASATSRRRIARLAPTYRAVFPTRGRDVRNWLSRPTGPMSGLLLLSCAPGESARQGALGRQRVRRRKRSVRCAEPRTIAPREIE